MATPIALPRILTIAEAERLGVSRAARRHGQRARGWQSLTSGILLTRDEPPTRDDWAAVGLALAGPGAALSGWDAARIHGLGSRAAPDRTVLVLDRDGNNRRIGDVLIRPTRRAYRTTLLPAEHPTLPYASVVSAARAVADTALMLPSFTPVRALVTGAIQRQRCTAADLARELERCPRGGSRWLRRALADVLVNAHSVAEAEAVELLTAARVPRFEVNVPVLGPDGSVIAVLDVLWRDLRAVAEIDGREFHFSETDWRRSLDRHHRLTRLGLAVEHHAPSAVRRPGRRQVVGDRNPGLASGASPGTRRSVRARHRPDSARGPTPTAHLLVIKRPDWSP